MACIRALEKVSCLIILKVEANDQLINLRGSICV